MKVESVITALVKYRTRYVHILNLFHVSRLWQQDPNTYNTSTTTTAATRQCRVHMCAFLVTVVKEVEHFSKSVRNFRKYNF